MPRDPHAWRPKEEYPAPVTFTAELPDGVAVWRRSRRHLKFVIAHKVHGQWEVLGWAMTQTAAELRAGVIYAPRKANARPHRGETKAEAQLEGARDVERQTIIILPATRHE